VYDVGLLTELGIAGRGVSADEARAAFSGRYEYNDMPAGVEQFADTRPFAATRVDIAAVMRVAAAYRQVVGTTPERTGQVGQELGEAAGRYFTLTQATDVDPAAFRNYLETTPDEQATLAKVRQLENLLADIRRLGLAEVEYRQARARVLSQIASEKLPADVLAKAIEKPRS
jgi:hypothetical protein